VDPQHAGPGIRTGGRTLIIQAPAKLNRFLAVLGRFADGFHELELVTTVLEGVDGLADTLEGGPASSFSLALEGPASGGLRADEGNLVVRAWRLLEREAGRELPAALRLHKRIPHGAGLGGGSSDAAAALKLGDALFSLGLGQPALLRLAAQLGSDVPLFVLGGTVLGLGRGERVFPLRPIPLEPILIVHPGLYVATPSVYKTIAQVGYPIPEPCPSLGPGASPPWRNDLAGAAVYACPALAEVRAALMETGGEPLLCGSGACWAARYATPEQRDAQCKALEAAHPGWIVWTV
jgi:4-diphosphocytidyl-2-C-methyl-D-erythritol kinase